jgi:hypothetical protein
MSTAVELVRAHVANKHPLLDAKGCPVCEWTLAQRRQTKGDSA